MGPVENLTQAEFVQIREEHPAKSRQLIIARALQHKRGQFSIDLEDAPSLVPIGLVAQAHGTRYFESTVRELRRQPNTPGGQPLRGDLLAALLLMGDELDLHEERAQFPAEMNRLPLAIIV